MGKSLKGKELGQGIVQRKDGRYSARFYGKDGKRIEKIFRELPDAKQWLIDARYEDNHSRIASARNMQVDDWFRFWIDEIKGETIRYGTSRAYRNRYKTRIGPIIGDMVLTDVKPIHCQQVLNHAQDEGDAMDSVKKLRVIMREFFEVALENELIPSNPVTSSVKYVHKEKEERRVLTAKEQQIFLETAKDFSYYELFAFALQTGLRCGELSGLKWEDIDFDAHSLTVNHSLNYREDLKMFVESPPKSRCGNRTIPLTSEAYRILMVVREKSQDLPLVAPYNHLIFRNSEGRPSHRGSYNRVIRKIAKAAQIPTLSMHTLRHSFATRCIEAGMQPKTLQKILGHSLLSLTMDLYVHVTDDTLAAEMKKLEKIS